MTHLDAALEPQDRVEAREVEVADERFDLRTLRFDRVHVTGREIVEALRLGPVEAYVVLRYRTDGALEDVGLEELEDLREPDRNSFFANASTETVNLMVGNVRLTWTQSDVTGTTIRRLARRADEDVELTLELDGGGERTIEDDEVVRLDRRSLARFHFRPAAEVEIGVNGKAVRIRRGWRDGAEIKAAAITQGVDIKANFTLSEDLPDGRSKIIGDDDRVRIRCGEQFLAVDDHDDS